MAKTRKYVCIHAGFHLGRLYQLGAEVEIEDGAEEPNPGSFAPLETSDPKEPDERARDNERAKCNLTRAQLKTALDERGIAYKGNASTEKLAGIYLAAFGRTAADI